jgi:hypothetical protein
MIVKARKGVVEHRQSAGAPRVTRQMFDIGDLRHRIGRALEYHQPGGPVAQHALDACEILDRQQGVRDAVLRQQMLHDVAGGAVGFDEGENVIALFAQ